MHSGRRGYRNVLETRPMGATVVETLTGSMSTFQIKRQQILGVELFDALPSLLEPARLRHRLFTFRLGNPRCDFSRRDNGQAVYWTRRATQQTARNSGVWMSLKRK